MEMGREVIADKGIWVAKKRYILNVHNSEGVQYKEPKLKIMGIEQSSHQLQSWFYNMKKLFKIIVAQTQNDAQHFVSVFKNVFKDFSRRYIFSERSPSREKICRQKYYLQ